MENNQYAISRKTPFSANGEQEFETRDSAVRSEHHADTIPYKDRRKFCVIDVI